MASNQATGARTPAHEPNAMETAQQYYAQSCDEITHLVSEHPISATMVTFGVGFGLGLILGTLTGHSPQPSWTQTQARHAEKLGRQLLDALSGVVPDAVSRRMHG